MSTLSAWFDLILIYTGGVVGLLINALIVAAAIAWQVYEYRKLWPHPKSVWWLIKIATPLLVVGIVALALLVFDIEGMAGLAVFYLSLFAALITAPVLIVLVGKIWSIPRVISFMAAVSLLSSLWVSWFAINGLSNNVATVSIRDPGKRVEYLAFKHAAENADVADGVIWLTGRDSFLLPDGERMIHLAFHVPQGYKIHGADVRTKRSHGGGDSGAWNSTLGSCVSPGHYHMTNVLDKGESFDVRLRFHQDTVDSMVQFIGEYEFRIDGTNNILQLIIDSETEQLRLPVPVPANWLSIVFTGAEAVVAHSLLPPVGDLDMAMVPGNRCLTGPLPALRSVESVSLELYSEDHYRRSRYSIPIVHR